MKLAWEQQGWSIDTDMATPREIVDIVIVALAITAEAVVDMKTLLG